MKVAINKCWGGFELSAIAKERLWAMKDPHMKLIPFKEYFSAEKMPTREEIRQRSQIFEQPIIGEAYLIDDHRDTENRACKMMIKVVEKLRKEGQNPSSRRGAVKIVTIPNGIKWDIHDYDGQEHVFEKHRTWR